MPVPAYHCTPAAVVVALSEVVGLFEQTVLSAPALIVGAGVMVKVIVLTTGVQLLPEEVRLMTTDPFVLSKAVGL